MLVWNGGLLATGTHGPPPGLSYPIKPSICRPVEADGVGFYWHDVLSGSRLARLPPPNPSSRRQWFNRVLDQRISGLLHIEAGYAYAEMPKGRHRFAARCERTGEQIETWVEVKGL